MAKMAPGQQNYNTLQTQKSQQELKSAPGYNATAGSAVGTALPAYQSIVANPGYSDAQKRDITGATLGGLSANYGTARNEAANRVARTGNSAGYSASLDDLARSQGQQTSTAEQQLGEKFADTAMSERDKALSGISSLYGTSADTYAKLLSGQNPNFQQQPTFAEQLAMTLMGNAKQAASGGVAG